MKELIEAVRKHALAHYEESGWDILVEAWSNADIRRRMGSATTLEEAIKTISGYLRVAYQFRGEIEGTAF